MTGEATPARLRLTEKQLAALAVVLPFGFLILGVAAVFVLASKKPLAATAKPPKPAPPVLDVESQASPTPAPNTP